MSGLGFSDQDEQDLVGDLKKKVKKDEQSLKDYAQKLYSKYVKGNDQKGFTK